MNGSNGTMRSSECSRDGPRRSRIIPVRTTHKNGASTKFATRKPKVINRERSILMDNVAEMARNASVKANLMSGDTMQVITEETETSVELLKDYGLSLDFTDLLGDDSLGHFLEDEEALLNDFNGFGVADDARRRIDDLTKMD